MGPYWRKILDELTDELGYFGFTGTAITYDKQDRPMFIVIALGDEQEVMEERVARLFAKTQESTD